MEIENQIVVCMNVCVIYHTTIFLLATEKQAGFSGFYQNQINYDPEPFQDKTAHNACSWL